MNGPQERGFADPAVERVATAFRKFRVQTLLECLEDLGHSTLTLYNEKLDLYPWGFKNRKLESKYREYFWLTFGPNNRALLRLPCIVWTFVAGCTFVQRYSSGGWQASTISHLALALLSFFGVWMFSAKHMRSWFKRLLHAVYEVLYWVMPVHLIAEACDPNANTLIVVANKLIIVTMGSWTCPYWTHHIINVALLDFVPVLWHGLGFGAATYNVRDWTTFGVLNFLFGVFFHGWLCVYRRQEWFQQRSRESKRRASRSGSRSPSPQGQTERRRSASPLRGRRGSLNERRGRVRNRSTGPLPVPLARVSEG